MDLWIVGRTDANEHPHAWEFIGVFDSEQAAVNACVTEDHMVGPIRLNENVESGVAWPGGWYPKLQDKPGPTLAGVSGRGLAPVGVGIREFE